MIPILTIINIILVVTLIIITYWKWESLEYKKILIGLILLEIILIITNIILQIRG